MPTCRRCHGLKGNHITISGLPAFFPCPDCKGTGEAGDEWDETYTPPNENGWRTLRKPATSKEDTDADADA